MPKNSSKRSEGKGNNKPSPAPKKKQTSPAKCWCFTLNNWTDQEVLEFQEIIKSKCKLGFFNKEVGEEGTPHLQGYIELLDKGRPLNMFPQCHWAKAKGNLDSNFKYCSKECDDGNMTFSYGKIGNPKIKVIQNLRPFQQSILDMLLDEVDEGKIIWIYDEIGQLGKTELLRYLYTEYHMPFSYGGKASDIINLVFNHKNYLLENDRAVMIYNFGRDTHNEKISYKSMEQISDGCISNTKFETGCFVCNKPHVLVFANCLPKLDKLTKSRWKVFAIENLQLVPYVIDSEEEDYLEIMTLPKGPLPYSAPLHRDKKTFNSLMITDWD